MRFVSSGARRHRVFLEGVASTTGDNDGGYTEAWAPLVPAWVWAAIVPATAANMERVIANTVQSTATHLLTIPYHAQVTTRTRITKGPRNQDGTLPRGSREFLVMGVRNPDERNVELRLACQETVSS